MPKCAAAGRSDRYWYTRSRNRPPQVRLGSCPYPGTPCGSPWRKYRSARPTRYFRARRPESHGFRAPGEVAERLNAAVLKTALPVRVTGVRIPPSPQKRSAPLQRPERSVHRAVSLERTAWFSAGPFGVSGERELPGGTAPKLRTVRSQGHLHPSCRFKRRSQGVTWFRRDHRAAVAVDQVTVCRALVASLTLTR